MAFNIIPEDVKTWEEQVKRCYPGQDPSGMGITSIGENQFSSASKLKYEDWLLLRIFWQRHDSSLTHEAIFGRDDGPRRKQTARNKLDSELWMKALDVEKDEEKKKDLLEWSWMAPWKLSVNDIGKRSPGASDLTSGKVYDDADPFRLVVEPFDPRGRPQRFINPDYAKLLQEREDRNQLVDEFVRKPHSREESVASSRSHKSQSPSKSEELALAASSNVGSLRGRAGTSSPGSGASAEARMINKHRPDEALINMSLTLLLQGVCMSLLHTTFADSYSWSILHKQFSVSHPNPNSQTRTKILTARTDGCLQAAMAGENADKGDTLAIVEVKPYRRHIPEANTVALRIQEGAEMAAWISTECMKGLLPSPSGTQTYRRLLISQDFDQVFVTIAEFDDLYIQYIRGDNMNWSIAPRGMPPASPLRGGQPETVAPREESKSRGILGAFRSSSKSPPSSKQPPSTPSQKDSTQLPHRGRAPPRTGPAPSAPTAGSGTTPPRVAPAAKPPVTPNRTPAGSVSPPNAPRPHHASPRNVIDQGGRGFLRMREYKGFRIQNSDDVKQLAYLLYSLTEYLCGDHHRQRLELEKSRRR